MCASDDKLLFENPVSVFTISLMFHVDACASTQPMLPQVQMFPLYCTLKWPPKHPAWKCFPLSKRPSIIADVPIPVPMVTATTSLLPRPAPNFHSPTAAIRASFSMYKVVFHFCFVHSSKFK